MQSRGRERERDGKRETEREVSEGRERDGGKTISSI
jgi:hypothetical protein